MKKQAEARDDNKITIIPEYGRQRLLTYAESFRDLADLFEGEDVEFTGKDEADPADRQDYLWQRRLQENQELLAEHLKEMAHIMAEVAQETCRYRPMGERKYKQISKLLRESGILLRNFFELEREDGHLEISLTMKMISEKYTKLGEQVCIDDVADFISVALNTRLRAAKNMPQYLTPEWNTYYFAEEANYHLLTGVAKAVKETEHISGDNYSFYEAENGRMVAVLSDGMGSGEKACDDSERIIEKMERLLEAGFRKETAIRMMNSAMVIQGEEGSFSTVDMASMDLYTGMCEFYKIGAAATYIKRGEEVECISSASLPAGIFHQLEIERSSRQLKSGDFVVLVTDGVTDCLQVPMPEETMQEILGSLDTNNPEQMAKQVLERILICTESKVPDDMTVLVAGIWEK